MTEETRYWCDKCKHSICMQICFRCKTPLTKVWIKPTLYYCESCDNTERYARCSLCLEKIESFEKINEHKNEDEDGWQAGLAKLPNPPTGWIGWLARKFSNIWLPFYGAKTLWALGNKHQEVKKKPATMAHEAFQWQLLLWMDFPWKIQTKEAIGILAAYTACWVVVYMIGIPIPLVKSIIPTMITLCIAVYFQKMLKNVGLWRLRTVLNK